MPPGLPPPPGERGGHPRYNQKDFRITHGQSFPLKIDEFPQPMMGVETPIPPVGMNAAAPGGAPPRRISEVREKNSFIFH